ncbi:MAG: hypothetical protein PHE83_17600 [Opitutaceae bacterium]|nr:hypothetical protein [Opitutaceae bacterium]
MSVILKPIKEVDPEDAEGLHITNDAWRELTADVPGVTPWNGLHDPIRYTPDELRAIAVRHPQWARQLEWLATEGGAELN